MADLGIVARMVEAGADRQEATAIVDQIMAHIAAQLLAGKTVRLDGLGILAAPLKNAWQPGFVGKRIQPRRRVALRSPATIERGEPYAKL